VKRLVIDIRPGTYTVAKLDPGAPVPSGLLSPDSAGFVSVTRTTDELSVICPEGQAPEGAAVETGWRLLTVRGPLEFALTGIMAALANELAAAGISLFAMSTFDTDNLLVKAANLARAADTLRAAGHEVHPPA
jgi:uncharacterized protein